jgi:hypothetical protein
MGLFIGFKPSEHGLLFRKNLVSRNNVASGKLSFADGKRRWVSIVGSVMG